MLFLSDRMTSASGSVGGSTFAHNRFGLYVRARRSPVNPNTARQQTVRNALSSAAASWRTITAPQRAGWEAYAAATPTTNKLGQTVFLSGFQQFAATSAYAGTVGEAVIGDAPTTPGRVPIGPVSIVIDASASTIVVSDLDAGVDGTTSVFVGDAVSAGVSFFAGPYQYRGSGTPAAGTFTIAAAKGRGEVPFVSGQRIPYRIAGYDSTGRLTTVASGITTVVA